MRPRPIVLVAALALAACDATDDGQLTEDPGPPVLVKLLIQDALPSGRTVMTDLLDKKAPIACSDRDPCPSGDRFSNPPCDLTTGLCPDPRNPKNTLAPIGTISSTTPGGNQIRLVFSKLLDPGIETETTINGQIMGYPLKDPSMVTLANTQGKQLPADVVWTPIGSPTLSSDPFNDPYGPALVLKNRQPLIPLTDYTLNLKLATMKDAAGQAVAVDVNGDPVATSYTFKTEGFRAAGGSLFIVDSEGTMDTRDALVIKTNARYDLRTLQVTVKKGGQPVSIETHPEYITDATGCHFVTDSPQQITIFFLDGGNQADWPEGEDYTVSVSVKAIDAPDAVFASDTFGTRPYLDQPFKVKAGADKDELFLHDSFRTMCSTPQPTDLGMPPNDLSYTPIDFSVPDDLAGPADAGVSD